jgi:hypothetical protein
MEPSVNLSEVWTTVGSVVGTPAAIFLFWIYTKVKELSTKVKILEKENSLMKQTLSDIRSDVSFIRGKLEDK